MNKKPLTIFKEPSVMTKLNLKSTLSGLTLALLLTQGAVADGDRRSYRDSHYSSAGSHRDYAKVTHVQPLYERGSRRIPETHCHIETYRESGSASSHTGTILGGIIGAAIGNELGHKKRNKQVGAVAGGLLGASIGRDVSRRNQRGEPRYQEREVCETHYRTENVRQLTGYQVSYKYRGRHYQTRTEQHPGDRIPVNLVVRPAL